MGKKFNYLNVPSHWKHYWTKYPEGYTILEALLNWVAQVDKMVDNINDWNEYLDDFVMTFDKDLRDKVVSTLREWQESGFLDVIIDEALQTEIDLVEEELLKKVNKDDLPYINIMEYGAVGDGIADDTIAFNKSMEKAIENKGVVFLPEGEFNIDISSVTFSGEIAPLIGRGKEKTKLKFKNGNTFRFNSGFFMENLTIETDYVIPTAESTTRLFLSNGQIDGLTIKNVDFINTGASSDGSLRGQGFIRATASNVHIENVKVVGCRNAFTFDGRGNKNLTFHNITIENAGSGFYITGSTIVPGLLEEDRIRNIQFSNIKFKNTKEQQANYSGGKNGKDVFMFEWCGDITINNVIAERPVERVAYFNSCKNILVTNTLNKFTDGWKFSAERNYIASGFNASNMKFIGRGEYNHCFTFYEVDGINVDQVEVENMNTVILMERRLRNIHAQNIHGRDLLRGVVQSSFANATERPYLINFSLKDVHITNPVMATFYPALNLDLWKNVSGYQYENIVLENIHLVQNDGVVQNTSGYDSGSRLKSLIEIDHIKGLYTKNNFLGGFSSQKGWVIVGQNSYDVFINEKMWVAENQSLPTGIYASGGSKIETPLINSSKKQQFNHTIYVNTNTSNYRETNPIEKVAYGEIKGHTRLAPGQETYLPYGNTLKVAYGKLVASNGEWMDFNLRGLTFTKTAGSENTEVANIDGKICVYMGNGTIVVRNRTSQTLDFYIHYEYSLN